MSFRPAGAARQSGAEFTSSLSGRVFSEVGTPEGATTALIDPVNVSPMGEDSIAKATVLRSQARERVIAGAPKSWRVTNRAKLGHVKVWIGAFDGEIFPEGARSDDKRTWLQPGESMLIPIEAGLHFCGNVFDPRAPEAREIIERTGGFELEADPNTSPKNAPVRIVGGPIGLPDFIVEPIDGRGRMVGEPVSIYETYDKVTRKLWTRRRYKDAESLDAAKFELEERIREYTVDDDMPLYDANGEVASTASTRAEGDLENEPDMRNVPVVEDDDTALTPRRRRGA